MAELPCHFCGGKRLKPEALAVQVGNRGIGDVVGMPIYTAREFFDRLELPPREMEIAGQILKEIRERLQFLVAVGLDYLTLERSAGTLAGGEAQRIRLATQIGSHLVGVLYVLDEPSIGLHQRDNGRLLETRCRSAARGLIPPPRRGWTPGVPPRPNRVRRRRRLLGWSVRFIKTGHARCHSG